MSNPLRLVRPPLSAERRAVVAWRRARRWRVARRIAISLAIGLVVPLVVAVVLLVFAWSVW